jgi:methionyl-tRNA formyltransferase
MTDFELIILAGVSQIFDSQVLRFPKFGMMTCHAGILPEYRGSSPLSWSFLNDKKFIGLSVIQTTAQIDGGDIYSSARFDIDQLENINDLHKLADENFPLLVHTAILNIENNIPPFKQISISEGYYPLRSRTDSQIEFSSMSAQYIQRLFNATSPRYGYPYFTYLGKEIEVLSVETRLKFHGTPGKVYQIVGNKILVACKIGAVLISVNPESQMKLFKRYELIC